MSKIVNLPSLIVEQGRDSKKWFASSKAYPGIEGVGVDEGAAIGDFIEQIVNRFHGMEEHSFTLRGLDTMGQYLRDEPLDGEE